MRCRSGFPPFQFSSVPCNGIFIRLIFYANNMPSILCNIYRIRTHIRCTSSLPYAMDSRYYSASCLHPRKAHTTLRALHGPVVSRGACYPTAAANFRTRTFISRTGVVLYVRTLQHAQALRISAEGDQQQQPRTYLYTSLSLHTFSE